MSLLTELSSPGLIPFYYCCLSFTVGAIVGLSELLSRYAWSLWHILVSVAGPTYLAINGGVAVLAYCAATQWNVHLGLDGKAEFWRALVVSLLAMGVLRSSFANLKVGDREFAAGFAALIDIFKHRAERSLDQNVAQSHLDQINPILEGMSYAATRNYMVVISRSALKSMSPQEDDAFTKEIAKIDRLEADDATKMLVLSLLIIQKTSMKLFAKLANGAKTKLAVQNESVNDLAKRRRDRLAEAKNLLKD